MTGLELPLVLLLSVAAVHWIGVAVFCVSALARTPTLDDVEPFPRGRWPRLSVVVPARNEGPALQASMEARLLQDYPNVEYIVVDDRSTDGTGLIADRLSSLDTRVRTVHVHRLPDGWIGKVHAQQCGLEQASGEWVLFTDADVHLRPGTLRRAMTLCQERQLDFLTALPSIHSRGVLLDAVYAVALRVGVFNLVRREALDRTESLRWLRLEVTDDVALGMMMKRSGAKCSVVNGRGWVELTWYGSVREMAVGMEKNAFSTIARYSLARSIGLNLLFAVSELLPFALLATALWIPAAYVCALILGSTLLVSRWLRRPLLPALLTPVAVALLVWMFVRGAWLGRKRGGVLWRGTLYPTELLREHHRLEFP
jgi:glycosyltransferase involved in cell wall biosynthesis